MQRHPSDRPSNADTPPDAGTAEPLDEATVAFLVRDLRAGKLARSEVVVMSRHGSREAAEALRRFDQKGGSK